MIISVTNLKGGVGKSTIARNLAVYFANQGEKVCLLDTDIGQRTTCEWSERREKSMLSLTLAKVDVFPMSTADNLLGDIRMHRGNDYSIIIIDGVPQLESLTTKIILSSDAIIVPVTPSVDDLRSFQKFVGRLNEAKTVVGEHKDIHAFSMLNRWSGRNNEDIEMREALEVLKEHGITPLRATVEDRVAHKRSSKYGKTVLEWSDTNAKEEVLDLCMELEKELIARLQK